MNLRLLLLMAVLVLTGGAAGAAETPPPQPPTPPGQRPEGSTQGWTVGVVKEGGQERLEFRRADSRTVCVCAATTFKVPGGMSLHLAAIKGQVVLRGPSLRARAERLSSHGPLPSSLVLEGHVQLLDERDGRHAFIRDGRVVLDLASGKLSLGSAEEVQGQKLAGTPAQASPPGEAGQATPPSPPPPDNIIYVKTRTFALNYTIEDEGPSRVKNVEVWVTRNTCSWQRYANNPRRQGPFTVTVNGEGRYGFTLVPRSGVGLADRPPKIGDQPQVWVEVDETRPVVNLYNVVVGRGAEAGKLTVYWTASDRFLRAQPITISYATKADGPWTALATPLANTGSYSCDCQDLPGEFYVKVEAVDRAGNIGRARTRDTVKVDARIPRIKGIKITARDTEELTERESR